MKNIFRTLFCLAAVSTVLFSCKENEPYEWAEGDVAGCYGVYFPAQEAAGSHSLDPTQDPVATFTVKRTNTDGAITVPVVATYSEDGIFTMTPVQFENGQSETTFTLSFPGAVAGTTYKASFEIQDPQYASKYNSNPIALDYTVLIEKWNSIGKGMWRDDFVTSLFKVENVEYEVEILENEMTPGFYRVVYPYDSKYPYNGDGDWDSSQTYYFEIHAEKPNQVWIPVQNSGMNWGYGYMWMGSYAGYQIVNKGKSLADVADYLGKLEKGVITFPTKSLLFGMEDYNDFALYYANTNGMFRLCLPGAVLTDWSIKVEAGETSEGVMPVALTLGADVAKVKYAVYEGTLSATQISNKTAGITDGSEANVSEYVPVEGQNVIGVTLEKTGVYTLVAVTFDASGEAHESASVEFDYVAKGDEVPVDVHCGLTVTDKYTPEGYTSENSLEYYIYGKDLKDVKVGIFSQFDMSDVQACVKALMESKSVSASVLAEINDKGVTDIASGLSPGTTYYLLVWASNGYESDIVSAIATTNGDPLPVYMKYTYASYDEEFEPKSESVLFGTYNLYGIDTYGKLGMREYLGKAVIADSSTPDEGPDDDGYRDEYITIKGLGGPACVEAKVDDTMEFDLYAGCFYNAAATTVDGNTAVYSFALGNGKFYEAAYVTYGIPVLDGYYAIVSTSNYYSSYNFSGYGFYNPEVDAEYIFAAYYDYLLVDPAKDDNGLAPKAAEARLARIQKALVNASALGLDGKEAIRKALESCTPENLFRPAGIEAEWEGVSVPVRTVAANAAPLPKSGKDMKPSSELVSLK